MIDQQASVPVVRADRGGSRLRLGGLSWLVAGLLGEFAMLPFLVPASQRWFVPSWVLWQLAGLLLGGLALLVGAILLAFGQRDLGIVGRFRLGQAALIIFGCSGILIVVQSLISLSFSETASAWVELAAVLGQVVVFLASAVVAVRAVRAGVLAAAARWVLVAIAVVDAVSVALLPTVVLGYSVCALVVRPALVVAAGVLIMREASRRSRSGSGGGSPA